MKDVTLDKIYFQPGIKDFFEKAINSDKLAHAYLFWGQKGVGKISTAIQIAKSLKQNAGDSFFNTKFSILEHPDIRILIPCSKKQSTDPNEYQEFIDPLHENPFIIPVPTSGNRIYIDLVRKLVEWLSVSPTYPGGKYAIIADAHRMYPDAANTFLKTLEEPKPDTAIFLTTNEPDSLLATIRSRSQFVNFPPIRDDYLAELVNKYYNVEQKRIPEILKMSEGSMAMADEIISGSLDDINKNAVEMIENALSYQLDRILLWAKEQPSDRQYMEFMVLELLRIVRNSMIHFATDKMAQSPIETQIAERSKGFSGFRDTIEMLENMLYEIRLNPQKDLFWSNLPFSFLESLDLRYPK
ncbi:MAG: ATP-binding protein [Candidatus Zixiibacteriota bacterium]